MHAILFISLFRCSVSRFQCVASLILSTFVLNCYHSLQHIYIRCGSAQAATMHSYTIYTCHLFSINLSFISPPFRTFSHLKQTLLMFEPMFVSFIPPHRIPYAELKFCGHIIPFHMHNNRKYIASFGTMSLEMFFAFV